MKPTVFIHTNHRQMVGALVSQHSIRRNSRHNDAFDVRIIDTQDFPFLAAREGQLYLRGGQKREWLMEDLQSFTPLRFTPPELMGYEGRAIVIDPDVFAVGDVFELLSRDMQGKALMCRARKGPKGLASSVMLLDCAKLTHWRTAEQFDEMFAFRRDYMEWISLKLEPRETIGLLEPEWNDFDHLGPDDQAPAQHQALEPALEDRPAGRLHAGRQQLLRPARPGSAGRARRCSAATACSAPTAPTRTRNQERFFFGLLRECLEQGVISEAHAARGDGAQPRPPRRLRGDRADPQARRLIPFGAASRPGTPGLRPGSAGARSAQAGCRPRATISRAARRFPRPGSEAGRGVGIERAGDVGLELRRVGGPQGAQRRDRLLVPVDPQIDHRPGLAIGDQDARRAHRAVLAAGREPGLERRDQAPGEMVGGALERPDHRRRHAWIGEQVAERDAGLAFGGGMAAERLRAAVPGDLAPVIDQSELAPGEVVRLGRDPRERGARRQPSPSARARAGRAAGR